MRWLSCFSLLLVLLLGCACTNTADEREVAKFAEDFVHTSLAMHPVNATSQGYHVHNGIALDEQLDDYSPGAFGRARDFYLSSLRKAATLKKRNLPRELQVDVATVDLECQSELLEIDQLQGFRHNPTVYVETIGNAVYNPFILNYAPESKRLAQITARLERIPQFLDIARKNLEDSPEIWNQVALEENKGNIELIDHTIREKVSPALKARYSHAADDALRSLRNFDEFLKTDLARRPSDWRLGARLYAQKFKLTLATGDTPVQALADAETQLQSIREDMRKKALALYPTFFSGQQPPNELNAVVSQVLDKIAQRHATTQTYFADAKSDLAEATKFVKDHHLLALPMRNNLEVIPTPEFMRGIYGVGGFSPAPALEPQLGAFYWITPFTPEMSKERVESKLREYNVWGLKILTIHEAMPGHYVQFEYADEMQPAWRCGLRAIFSNGPYTEGWAVYATEFMIDAGYPDAAPNTGLNSTRSDQLEMRLTFGKQMLRVVSNTILDIKLQTMGMTDQQALDLMVKNTFQEQEEAEKKLQRAKLSSCQLPTYFVGWRGWDRLRDAYRNKHGSEFRLSEFNELGLKEGAIPLPYLNEILLQ